MVGYLGYDATVCGTDVECTGRQRANTSAAPGAGGGRGRGQTPSILPPPSDRGSRGASNPREQREGREEGEGGEKKGGARFAGS
eukprot:3373773-Rhodomonas_salina.1